VLSGTCLVDPEVPGSIPGADFLRSNGSGTGFTQPCEYN
jgi:hypothetical protein